MRSPKISGTRIHNDPKPKWVHSFGRADQVDRAALERLVHSVRRVLVDDGIQEVMAKGEPVKVADIEIERVQELGVPHVAKALWEKLGIGAAIKKHSPSTTS